MTGFAGLPHGTRSIIREMTLELTSTEFILLLPPVVFLYYLIPNKSRQYFLLLINLLFYASFGYRYIPVIMAEAFIAWAVTYIIAGKGAGGRKALTATAVVVLIAILGFFKFGDRLSGSIIAPLGISFYTLQAISYIIDVYRGDVFPENNPLILLTYLSFFPTITSGPIYRYKDFIIENKRNNSGLKPEYDRMINGMVYMLYGYFLKLVIASRAGTAVDKVFGDYQTVNYGGVVLAVVACLYSVQIYTDFAGYSAIVIGIAQIVGYKVPENFLSPYMSMSIKEFWGRWHISLSSWLKDYIYIPLGGNRKGKFRKYLNILVTFIISGIWHTVNGWHYIVWGLIHGVYQIVGNITSPYRRIIIRKIGMAEDGIIRNMLKRAVTFGLVTVAWVFFRNGTVGSVRYLMSICSLDVGNAGVADIGLTALDCIVLPLALIIVLIVDYIQYRTTLRFDEVVSLRGTVTRCAVIVSISLVILIFGLYGDQHDAGYFIYRDF